MKELPFLMFFLGLTALSYPLIWYSSLIEQPPETPQQYVKMSLNEHNNDDDKTIGQRPWPEIGPHCPLAAQNNYGIFDTSSSNSTVKNNFRDVILLVGCNYAYYDMLQNWEFLANELNLKWAVLALDEQLYDVLGSDRAISPGSFSVPGPQKFRRGDFNKLSCNKMRMVLLVAENCGLDIVFSDVDNVFYQNPFEHDLGRLIESQRYDYIYQSNHVSPKIPRADRCLQGSPRSEANTGFYFMSRNSDVIKTTVNATLDVCHDPLNAFDDQTLFWTELWKLNMTYVEPNKTFHHCTVPEYLEPLTFQTERSKQSPFNFCCLDPYYYPIGKPPKPKNKNPVSYHANYVKGKNGKIQKIVQSRSDHYGWNHSRIHE